MAHKLSGQYVSPIELQKLIGCSRQRIYVLLEKYKVPTKRFNRFIMVKKADAEKFLKDRDQVLKLSGTKGNKTVKVS